MNNESQDSYITKLTLSVSHFPKINHIKSSFYGVMRQHGINFPVARHLTTFAAVARRMKLCILTSFSSGDKLSSSASAAVSLCSFILL